MFLQSDTITPVTPTGGQKGSYEAETVKNSKKKKIINHQKSLRHSSRFVTFKHFFQKSMM